jgi:hypothetical protein
MGHKKRPDKSEVSKAKPPSKPKPPTSVGGWRVGDNAYYRNYGNVVVLKLLHKSGWLRVRNVLGFTFKALPGQLEPVARGYDLLRQVDERLERVCEGIYPGTQHYRFAFAWTEN